MGLGADPLRDVLYPRTRATLSADPHIGMRGCLSYESRVALTGSAWTTGQVLTLPRPNASTGWSAATATLANSTTYPVASLSNPGPGCPYYLKVAGGCIVSSPDNR